MEELELKIEFEVGPDALYDAWLDSEQHGDMTMTSAEIDARVGGKHSAGDGYIWGEILELDPGKRILQTWRTTDFAEADEDSLLELTFEATEDGTLMTLRHTRIPAGQGESYQQGWQDYYFDPMEEYFEG